MQKKEQGQRQSNKRREEKMKRTTYGGVRNLQSQHICWRERKGIKQKRTNIQTKLRWEKEENVEVKEDGERHLKAR